MQIGILTLIYCAFAFLLRNINRFQERATKYEIKALFWGAFGASILSAICEMVLLKTVKISFNYVVMFIGPFIEEVLKGIFLIYLLSRLRYRSLTMGIVYGSLIGLGFAYIENIVYILSGTSLLLRLLSGMLHIVETGFAGMLLAYGLVYRPGKMTIIVILTVVICSLLHISVNVTCYSTTFAPLLVNNLLCQILIFAGVILLVFSAENRMIGRELKAEVSANILPEKEYQTILLKVNNFPYFRSNNQLFLCAARLAMVSHYKKVTSLDFYKREMLVKRITLYRKLYGVSA